MGLFDKVTGSRTGNPGVAPVPAAELRSALLALGNGDWQVRDGADHHCDLVAEWHTEVQQDMGPGEGGLKAAFRVKMKFHEDKHEVHHNSEQSGSSWHTQNSPGMMNQPGGQFGGQAGFGNNVGYGAGGQSGALGYNFSSSEITHPLRDRVTSLGWGWKAAVFKL
jgi:hypothetical protein